MGYVVFGVAFAFWIGWSHAVEEGNFTFTYAMAMRCKEHLCRNGYSYDTFYRVDPDVRKNEEVEFEMHLAILAGSNGHILLSQVPNPEPSDAVYEIVVGGGANKFTELRRNLRRNAKASAKTVGILSPVQFSAFYIRISEDGVIEFGREGDPLPVISYSDVTPLTIKYFSFAAWNGVEAKFLYDCPAPGDNTSSPDSQELQPRLSPSEQLTRTLLLDRPPAPPALAVDVRLGIGITSVRYDPFESKLVTGMAIVASWTDDSMAWDPTKFNGTTRLMLRQGQLWRPDFFVYNSDDVNVLDTTQPALISLLHSGEATFHFQSEITTWCYEYAGDYNRWPHDQYSCSIVIGAYEPHETIHLEEMDSTDDKMKVFEDINGTVLNEWDLILKKGVVTAKVWNTIFLVDDNQTHQSDRLVLHLELTRRAAALDIVVYIPLISLMTFVLVSFWNEPLQLSRVSFYAGAVVIICTLLCFIDNLVPVHTMPSILVLYTTVLGGVGLALIIQVLLGTALLGKVCRCSAVQTALSARWIRVIYCLPEKKSCQNYESVNEGFANLEDDESLDAVPRNSAISEMQTDEVAYTVMEELALCIDRSLFIIYSVTFSVMLGMHY